MPTTRYSIENDNCEPFKKHRYDAGWDLRSNKETFTLKAGAKVEVPTGVRLGIPRGFVGLLVPRSGLGTKHRITLANDIGVIDADYRGEVKAVLVNDGHADVEIEQYSRICQIMIVPVVLQSLRKTTLLGETKRGDDGFGSSGEQ